ncbi:MAG: hypothetical protein IJD81_00390 [Oscillospiraceae bacterium]|nr:hypothetical protein [Oscillospiraceae bacterium]
MVDVVSIKFKTCGKVYYFDPNGNEPKEGERVVVETANGRELAICSQGVHAVADDRVIQPLQPVIRVATPADLRVLELNKKREAEAFDICKKKIAEHELDMKLVDVECNFDGNKITFFFTSDGRVDFRELVKDLASVFRSRIELRQIGVRDEAKMLGGLGICGRPFCCSQFLNEFYPVSTKMAKVQNLSLNPKKISGCCGRLMCCLRYEQEAYEDLVKTVPKNGAFVETPDGYGNITQVNLLRQTVKVKLDGENEQRNYTSKQVAAVPGGRPKDGEAPAHVLEYVPEEEPVEEEVVDEWNFAILEDYEDLDKKRERREKQAAEEAEQSEERRSRRSRGGRGRNRRGGKPAAEKQEAKQEVQEKPVKPAAEKQEKKQRPPKPQKKQSKQPAAEKQEKPAVQQPKADAEGGEKKANRNNNRRRPRPHRPRSDKKSAE